MLEVEGGTPEWCMQDPAPRGRPRHRQRLQAAAAAAASADLRPVLHAVSGVLHAEAVQQELRAAPRQLVRAEPSRRGLRRDVRGVAEPGFRLAHALRRLAGAEEARVHGHADERDRRQADARARRAARSSRSRACKKTLRAHYERKRRHYGLVHPHFYDRDLRKLFSDRAGARREHEGGALHRARAPRRPPHGRGVDRRVSIHDRPGDREHDQARQRAEPAPGRHPKSAPSSTSSSCSPCRR